VTQQGFSRIVQEGVIRGVKRPHRSSIQLQNNDEDEDDEATSHVVSGKPKRPRVTQSFSPVKKSVAAMSKAEVGTFDLT
jgi:hypothetical protein